MSKLSKRKQKQSNAQKFNLELKDILPITDNQVEAFEYYKEGYHMSLLGCAGTGKTFISMFLAFKEIFDSNSRKQKLIIVRTPQPCKNIGFLPGTEKQKIEAYEDGYKEICNELFGRGDAYEVLKQKGIIEFKGTSFLRSITLDDSVILVDEVQNQSYQEIRTVLTRPGERSKIIICGDTKQDDLTSARYSEETGIHNMSSVISICVFIK